MKSLSLTPNLYHGLIYNLVKCGPFQSNFSMRSIFVDARINKWEYLIYDGNNPQQRVEQLVAILLSHGSQINALVLFIEVLIDRIHCEDDCSRQLLQYKNQLNKTILEQNT